MAKADARSEKESFVLVTFLYGANLGSQARYTDWDEPFLGHASEPRMSLRIPANEGTFQKQELRIVLPVDSFTGRIGSGVPHSPTYVIVEEATQGLFTGDQNSQRFLFAGKVSRAIRGYQGRRDRVAFKCLPVKSRLDLNMGLPCNHHCAWALFKGKCGASKAAHSFNGEIDSVDGQEATVTTSAVLAQGAADARYFKRGYLEKDGLRIAIRDYDGSVDTGKFHMARRVPTDWIGGSGDILFVAGCDKSVETCRSRFNQEDTFMGVGFKIPSYQPNTESPA